MRNSELESKCGWITCRGDRLGRPFGVVPPQRGMTTPSLRATPPRRGIISGVSSFHSHMFRYIYFPLTIFLIFIRRLRVPRSCSSNFIEMYLIVSLKFGIITYSSAFTRRRVRSISTAMRRIAFSFAARNNNRGISFEKRSRATSRLPGVKANP